MKEFADDNFEFDENSKTFSKQMEKNVAKGEIARYVTHKNQGLFWKGLNCCLQMLSGWISIFP